jgi:hypothetical protein
MNFIISLVMWALLFIVSMISGNFAQGDWKVFLVGLQVVFAGVFFIFFLVMIFYQMSGLGQANRIRNAYFTHQKKITLHQQKYKELKEYYEKYLATNYPELEKEIFNKITESQPKELTVLLQSYPELKTSLVFSELMKGITSLVDRIYSCRMEADAEIEKLENIKIDSWMIFKPKTTIY